MLRLIQKGVVVLFASLCVLYCGVSAFAQEVPSDYQEVLKFLDRKGDFKAGVLKVNIPRSDLKMSIQGFSTPTPFGFGGWIALTKGTDGSDVMMGDLVLLQEEVNPVMSALLDNGIDVTAFGRVDAEVKQARGANAEAILLYRNSVLHAAEDVEDSFSLLGRSEARGDEILIEIGALQRVRDRSLEAYQAGVIGLTDVLDAERQLLVAKDDLAVARQTAAQAAVGSFRALGGGWTP